MKIVFLTYINRSGSTYLANLLSASDDICVCPEADVLISYFLESPGMAFRLDKNSRAALVKLIHSDSKLKYWGIGDDIFHILEEVKNNIGAFLAILHYYKTNQKPDASCILFKAERLASLLTIIENCRASDHTFKYLSMIRDPRGLYESQKRTRNPQTGRPMSRHPVYTAIYWNHYIKALLTNCSQVDCYQLFFYDFIRKMHEELISLSTFLGLNLKDISPGNGDLADRLPDGQRDIHSGIADGPRQEKIEQWRKELSLEEICLIERICKRYFGEIGFVATRSDYNIRGMTFKIKYYTFLYLAIQLTRKARFHMKRVFKLAE
jgi:hypothetical protein